MVTVPFETLADALRIGVMDYYEARNDPLSGPAGLATLETNSGYVERRAQPLLDILLRECDVASLRNRRVLDVGCGFGALSVFFASRGASVIAVDPEDSRFDVGRAVAERFGLEADFRPGRMESLNLPNEAFDVAVVNNSLCYVVDRRARLHALREIRRVLRPHGAIVVRNPNRWTAIDQFSGIPLLQLLPPRAADRVARLVRRRRSSVTMRSPRAGRRELVAAGFTDVHYVGHLARPWPGLMSKLARYQHFTGRRPTR